MNNKLISVSCSFYGEEFSAKKLKEATKLPLIINAEKGENGLVGRYKGKLCPYSSAKLEFSSNQPLKIQLEELKNLLATCQNKLENFIIENIEINAFVSYEQSNTTEYTTVIFDKNIKLLNIEENFAKTEAGEELLASLGLINKVMFYSKNYQKLPIPKKQKRSFQHKLRNFSDLSTINVFIFNSVNNNFYSKLAI